MPSVFASTWHQAPGILCPLVCKPAWRWVRMDVATVTVKGGWGNVEVNLWPRCAALGWNRTVLPWNSSSCESAPRGERRESDILDSVLYWESGRTSKVPVGIWEDCKQVSSVRNKGLACLPLLLSTEVVPSQCLIRMHFSTSVMQLKMPNETHPSCYFKVLFQLCYCAQRKEKAMQKYCLLLTWKCCLQIKEM